MDFGKRWIFTWCVCNRNRVKLRNPWGHTGEVELDEDEEDGVFWQSVVCHSLASQMGECAELS